MSSVREAFFKRFAEMPLDQRNNVEIRRALNSFLTVPYIYFSHPDMVTALKAYVKSERKVLMPRTQLKLLELLFVLPEFVEVSEHNLVTLIDYFKMGKEGEVNKIELCITMIAESLPNAKFSLQQMIGGSDELPYGLATILDETYEDYLKFDEAFLSTQTEEDARALLKNFCLHLSGQSMRVALLIRAVVADQFFDQDTNEKLLFEAEEFTRTSHLCLNATQSL